MHSFGRSNAQPDALFGFRECGGNGPISLIEEYFTATRLFQICCCACHCRKRINHGHKQTRLAENLSSLKLLNPFAACSRSYSEFKIFHAAD